MRIKYIIALIAFSSNLIAQTPIETERRINYYFPNYPKSPSTFLFTKYGEVQNSKYTGSNSPKIDLINIENEVMNIPISLNYISGNGIKVKQEASSVGLGWTIPMPTITQSILGKDDFDTSFSKLKPDYMANNSPFPSQLASDLQITGICVPNLSISNPTNTINNQPQEYSFGYYTGLAFQMPVCNHFLSANSIIEWTDTQPDVFLINLFGERIEFASSFQSCGVYSNTNYQFKVLNRLDYSIQYSNAGFEITDNKGIKYYFTQKETVNDYHSGAIEKNWFLTKIKNLKNKEINFNYTQITNVGNLVNLSQVLNYTTDSFKDHTTAFGPNASHTMGYSVDDYSWEQYTIAANSKVMNSTYAKSFQNYIYLSEIVFDNGKVTFDYSNREDNATKKIDFIRLYNYKNNLVKSIVFNYSYFLANTTTNYYQYNINNYNIANDYLGSYNFKRLKLDSISINNDENYSFDYESVLFPPKTSFAVDYWGYYNGANSNLTFIPNPNDFNINNPTMPVFAGINDNIKTSNLNFLKAGMLKKITYPTKGYSEFEYEENEATNLFSSNNPSTIIKGNGLRMKFQTNFSNLSQIANKMNFQYEDGLCMNPISFKKNMNLSSKVSEYSKQYITVLQFNSNSFSSSYLFSNGDYTGYSKVIEFEESGNGKKISFYANTLGYVDAPMNIPNRKGINTENGLIIKEQIFDSSNSLKLEDLYTYITYLTPDMNYGVIKRFDGFWICSYYDFFISQLVPSYNSATKFGYYPIYSTKSVLTKKQTKEYFGSNIVENEVVYNYDTHRLVSQVSYSTGKLTKYFYPYNRLNDPFVAAMHYGNKVFDELIETQDYDQTTLLNTTKKIFANDASTNNFILPKSIFSSKGSNSLEKKITYDFYDTKGNITQYTIENGTPVSIIWGYNNTQPIAKIENATYASISESTITNLQNLSNTGTEANLIIALNNLRTSLPNAMITTYTHKPLVGVSTVTDPKGDLQSYHYDNFNRLQFVKDKDDKILSENQYHYKN